jgi:hypothetical protein
MRTTKLLRHGELAENMPRKAPFDALAHGFGVSGRAQNWDSGSLVA